MKPFTSLIALLTIGGVTAGCGDNTVTAPSPASSVQLTATLPPSTEVPPITGSEASGSGTAAVPSGSGSFTKQGVSLTVDQANAIMANPAGFYVNIHTGANPGGVARGQLSAAQ